MHQKLKIFHLIENNHSVVLILVSSLLRDEIVEGQTTEKLRNVACEQGMTTLMSDGLKKVEQGIISLDELLAVAL